MAPAADVVAKLSIALMLVIVLLLLQRLDDLEQKIAHVKHIQDGWDPFQREMWNSYGKSSEVMHPDTHTASQWQQLQKLWVDWK